MLIVIVGKVYMILKLGKILILCEEKYMKICYDNSIDCIHIVYGHFVIEKFHIN